MLSCTGQTVDTAMSLPDSVPAERAPSVEDDPYLVSSLMPALAQHAHMTAEEVRDAARAEMDELVEEERRDARVEMDLFEQEERDARAASAAAARSSMNSSGGDSGGGGGGNRATPQIHRPYDRPWAHDMSQHLRPDQRARRQQRQLPAPPPFKVGGHVEIFSDPLHDPGLPPRSDAATRRRKRDANPKAQKRSAAARVSVFQRLSDPARFVLNTHLPLPAACLPTYLLIRPICRTCTLAIRTQVSIQQIRLAKSVQESRCYPLSHATPSFTSA